MPPVSHSPHFSHRVERGMPRIVLARLYFDWQDLAVSLNKKIKFSLLSAVEIVTVKTVRRQLLCRRLFINGPVIDILFVIRNIFLSSIPRSEPLRIYS